MADANLQGSNSSCLLGLTYFTDYIKVIDKYASRIICSLNGARQ